MATEVENWLKGDRNYLAGLKLLEQNGVSKFLLDMLQKGPDHYNTPKLLQLIEKLPKTSITAEKQISKPLNTKPEAAHALPGPATYRPDKNLEKTLRIKEIIKQLWKEMTHLKAQLPYLPEGEKLYECARDLVTKNLRRQDYWDHLHYFEKNGEWFDELDENAPKPFDLELEIKNLMANRSKASAKLKKPLPAAKIKFYQAKVNLINEKIEKLKKLRADA